MTCDAVTVGVTLAGHLATESPMKHAAVRAVQPLIRGLAAGPAAASDMLAGSSHVLTPRPDAGTYGRRAPCPDRAPPQSKE